MTYKIKPEFLDLWEGGDEPSDPDRIITEEMIDRLAADWDKPVNEILSQLEPQCGFTLLHRFPGKHDWQELNDLIRFDSGVEEPYCETEEDYNLAVKDGFIKFEDGVTTVWED